MGKLIKNKYLLYTLVFSFSILIVISSFVFQEKLSSLKTFGLIGIFFINFFSTATIFVPNFSSASVIAGGSLYSPILVAIAATFGSILGDSTSYILGRSGKEIFFKKEGRVFVFTKSLFEKNGIFIIFVLAMIPNPLFDAVGIVAGSFKYSYKRYIIAMLAGRMIRNIALAYLGNSL